MAKSKSGMVTKSITYLATDTLSVKVHFLYYLLREMYWHEPHWIDTYLSGDIFIFKHGVSLVTILLLDFVTIQAGFSQIDKIGNNGNIWHQRLYCVKKIQWQNVTSCGNRTQAASDSKSNTILSTLTWHLLTRLRL